MFCELDIYRQFLKTFFCCSVKSPIKQILRTIASMPFCCFAVLLFTIVEVIDAVVCMCEKRFINRRLFN